MKAVVYDRYGGPDLLRLAEIDMPEPAKGEIRVKVLACAVNLSDWEYLTGSPAWVRTVGGLFKPKVSVLGSDIVGHVDKLGEGVSGFEIGQRVMGDYVMTRGGFAEYACVPADETVAVPDALTDDIASCLPQAGGIAVAGTEGLLEGDRFLINGAGGGSGTMALQLAKAAGAHVTAVDNAGKTDWLSRLGADEVIDYAKMNFTETGKKWDRISTWSQPVVRAKFPARCPKGEAIWRWEEAYPRFCPSSSGGNFCRESAQSGCSWSRPGKI